MSAKKHNAPKYFKPALLVLSAIGILLSLYLTYLHFTETEAAFCAAGSDCEAVRQSGFSTFLGIPVAALGVLGYLVIFILTLLTTLTKRARWTALYILSLSGFIFSAYLTYLEFFVIKAICTYCVVSAVLMTIIFIILLREKPALYPKLSAFKTLILSVFIALVVIFSSAAVQYGKFDEARDLAGLNSTADAFQTGLAKYLGGKGAVMYGSYKCPHCNEQKKLFGGAFRYIKYVECHPRGENANPSLCFANGITNYPTWEIGGRFYQGAMSLEELSEVSGYDGSF
ncbi:MAG: vitamin K epoxide reductase family protein [Deltaproteobacteria bacterium]